MNSSQAALLEELNPDVAVVSSTDEPKPEVIDLALPPPPPLKRQKACKFPCSYTLDEDHDLTAKIAFAGNVHKLTLTASTNGCCASMCIEIPPVALAWLQDQIASASEEAWQDATIRSDGEDSIWSVYGDFLVSLEEYLKKSITAGLNLEKCDYKFK